MRRRFRTSPQQLFNYGTYRWRIHSPPGTWQTVSETAQLKFTPSHEEIYDAGGTSGSCRGVRWFNPVQHYGWVTTKPPTVSSAAGYGYFPGGPTTVKDFEFSPWVALLLATTPFWQSITDADVGCMVGNDLVRNVPADSRIFERCQSTLPTMRSKFNLSVFLYELTDIKRMFELLPSKHLTFKGSPVRNWKEALRYANGLHLNYNFGWKPFHRDVVNVIDGLNSFDERFEKYSREAGSDFVHHAGNQDETYQSQETFLSPSGYYEAKVERTYTVRFNSTIHGSYSLPDYGRGELRFRSMLDTLGLHVNPAVVWAVMSKSFVVDWFVNVGNQVAAHTPDWTQPMINIHQACHSRKVTMCASTWTVRAVVLSNPLTQACCSGSAHLYTRSIGTGTASWEPSALTADRVRLLSSMFADRLLR